MMVGMAYIKYKEITKYFNFSKVLPLSDLPSYVGDYVFEDEEILVGYKTSRDHGVFTTKKIVLFDNFSLFGLHRQIYTVPYKSISSCSVIFESKKAELSLFLDSGYPVRLKFINMKGIDKLRLRILYSCISRAVNNQKMNHEDVRKLQTNDLHFKN